VFVVIIKKMDCIVTIADMNRHGVVIVVFAMKKNIKMMIISMTISNEDLRRRCEKRQGEGSG